MTKTGHVSRAYGSHALTDDSLTDALRSLSSALLQTRPTCATASRFIPSARRLRAAVDSHRAPAIRSLCAHRPSSLEVSVWWRKKKSVVTLGWHANEHPGFRESVSSAASDMAPCQPTREQTTFLTVGAVSADNAFIQRWPLRFCPSVFLSSAKW